MADIDADVIRIFVESKSVAESADLKRHQHITIEGAAKNQFIVGGKRTDDSIGYAKSSDHFAAVNEAAMLALDAWKGDTCARADNGKTYKLTVEGGAGTVGNWAEIGGAGGGSVALPADEIGFGNATSDGITSSPTYKVGTTGVGGMSVNELAVRGIAYSEGAGLFYGEYSAGPDFDWQCGIRSIIGTGGGTNAAFFAKTGNLSYTQGSNGAGASIIDAFYVQKYHIGSAYYDGKIAIGFGGTWIIGTSSGPDLETGTTYNINGAPHTHSQYAADGVVGSVQLSNGSGAMSSVTGLVYTTAGALAVPANATGLAATLSTAIYSTYNQYADNSPLLTLTNTLSNNSNFVGIEFKGVNTNTVAQEAYFGAVTQAGASVYDMKFVWQVKNGASTFFPVMEYSLAEGLIVTANSSDAIHSYYPTIAAGYQSGFCCELDSWEAGTSTARKTCYAEMYGEIVDNTYTSEDGALVLKAMVGGTLTEQARLVGGNIGLGSVTPLNRIHTYKGTGTAYGITIEKGGTSGAGYIELQKNRSSTEGGVASVIDTDTLGVIYFTGADGTSRGVGGAQIRSTVSGTPATGIVPAGLEFWTTNASGTSVERMRITADGKVGIGINAPETALDVVGDGIFMRRYVSSSTVIPYIGLYKARGTVGTPTTILTGDDLFAYRGYAYDGANALECMKIWGEATGTVLAGVIPTDIIFSSTNSAGTLTERMRIAADGKVGIGGTPTFSPLDVFSDGGVAAPIALRDTRTNDIDVGPSLSFVGKSKTNGVTELGQIKVLRDNASTNDGAYMSFVLRNTSGSEVERMRIAADGKVGIGKTATAYALEVAGSITASAPLGVMLDSQTPSFTGGNIAEFYSNSNSYRRVLIKNSNAGSGAYCYLSLANDTADEATFGRLSSTFSSANDISRPSTFFMRNSAGPIHIGADVSDFRVYTGGVASTNIRLTILQAGGATFSGTLTSTGAFTASSTSSHTGVATFSNTRGIALTGAGVITTCGDLAYDTTFKEFVGFAGNGTTTGLKRWMSGEIYTAYTAGTSVTNTVTATDLLTSASIKGTKTLPATHFVAGKKFTVTITGSFNASTASSFNLQLRLGSSNLGNVTIPSATYSSQMFKAVFLVYCSSGTAATTEAVLTFGANNAVASNIIHSENAVTGLATTSQVLTVFSTASSATSSQITVNVAHIEEC